MSDQPPADDTVVEPSADDASPVDGSPAPHSPTPHSRAFSALTSRFSPERQEQLARVIQRRRNKRQLDSI